MRKHTHRRLLREGAVHRFPQIHRQRRLIAAIQCVFEAAIGERRCDLLGAADQQAAQEDLSIVNS